MYCVRFLLLLTFFDFYLYNLFVTNCEKYFLGGYIKINPFNIYFLEKSGISPAFFISSSTQQHCLDY